MSKDEKTFDVECAVLARYFLNAEDLGTDENVHDLAVEIQEVVERFIERLA